MERRTGYAPASDDFVAQHSIWRSAENAETGVRVYYWGVVGVASASWAIPPWEIERLGGGSAIRTRTVTLVASV